MCPVHLLSVATGGHINLPATADDRIDVVFVPPTLVGIAHGQLTNVCQLSLGIAGWLHPAEESELNTPLAKTRLSGVLPTQVGQLTNLLSLHASGNLLLGTIRVQ